jgi:PIN domain nuclease of toxin-antitoxin system
VNVLLDTCTFLWIVTGAAELSELARGTHENPENVIYLSAVSTWEISVKHSLGRLALPEPPEKYIPKLREAHGVDALPLDEESTLNLHRLPNLHRDPFDRMLICQAIVNGLVILTPDELISQYPIRSIW